MTLGESKGFRFALFLPGRDDGRRRSVRLQPDSSVVASLTTPTTCSWTAMSGDELFRGGDPHFGQIASPLFTENFTL